MSEHLIHGRDGKLDRDDVYGALKNLRENNFAIACESAHALQQTSQRSH
jgi:hypothetical protein